MANPQLKANVGMALVVLFLITLVTGIILHLKSHGVIVEPPRVIKPVHWIAGLLMVAFACWHRWHFKAMLRAMRKKHTWFMVDSRLVVILILLTLITGLIKLLSPVKIPHLGQWHYVLGLIMSAAVIVHLFRGIPSWNRLRKLVKK